MPKNAILLLTLVVCSTATSKAQQPPSIEQVARDHVEKSVPQLNLLGRVDVGNGHVAIADLSVDHSRYVLAGYDRIAGRDQSKWQTNQVPGWLTL